MTFRNLNNLKLQANGDSSDEDLYLSESVANTRGLRRRSEPDATHREYRGQHVTQSRENDGEHHWRRGGRCIDRTPDGGTRVNSNDGRTKLGVLHEVVMTPVLLLFTPSLVMIVRYVTRHCGGKFAVFCQEIVDVGLMNEASKIWMASYHYSTFAAAVLVGYLLFLFLSLVLLPGKLVKSPVLPNGNRILLKCNGFTCFLATMVGFTVATLVLKSNGWSPSIIYKRLDEFLCLMVILSYTLIVLIPLIKLPWSSNLERKPVSLLLDYYWQNEPSRVFGTNLKVLTSCRITMTMWSLFCLICAIKSYEKHGLVDSIWISCGLEMLYFGQFFWGEADYVCSIDLSTLVGYYTYWCSMSLIPGFYASASVYLVKHPVFLGPTLGACIFGSGVLILTGNYFYSAYKIKDATKSCDGRGDLEEQAGLTMTRVQARHCPGALPVAEEYDMMTAQVQAASQLDPAMHRPSTSEDCHTNVQHACPAGDATQTSLHRLSMTQVPRNSFNRADTTQFPMDNPEPSSEMQFPPSTKASLATGSHTPATKRKSLGSLMHIPPSRKESTSTGMHTPSATRESFMSMMQAPPAMRESVSTGMHAPLAAMESFMSTINSPPAMRESLTIGLHTSPSPKATSESLATGPHFSAVSLAFETHTPAATRESVSTETHTPRASLASGKHTPPTMRDSFMSVMQTLSGLGESLAAGMDTTSATKEPMACAMELPTASAASVPEAVKEPSLHDSVSSRLRISRQSVVSAQSIQVETRPAERCPARNTRSASRRSVSTRFSPTRTSPRRAEQKPERPKLGDKILQERTKGRKKEYLVKWKGQPVSKATWEIRKNIEGSLIKNFKPKNQK